MDFVNVGGLVTPIPLTITFADGRIEERMIPAQIWRRDAERVTQLMIEDEAIESIEIDANNQIADADEANNTFPPRVRQSRFDLYRSSSSGRTNQMQRALEELQGDQKTDANAEETDAVPLTGGEGAQQTAPEPSEGQRQRQPQQSDDG